MYLKRKTVVFMPIGPLAKRMHEWLNTSCGSHSNFLFNIGIFHHFEILILILNVSSDDFIKIRYILSQGSVL